MTGVHSQTVFYDENLTCGWPANAGAWHWGNEMLCAFHVGVYQWQTENHNIDRSHPITIGLARSTDGGESWTVELDNPINMVNDHPPIPVPEGGIHFSHPDFALKVGKASVEISNETYLVTYDRGHTWQGPYMLPNADASMSARTDYLVEGQGACIMLLSRRMRGVRCLGHPDRAYAVRTDDGGHTWTMLGYLANKQARSVMTNTVRMSDGRLVTALSRRRDPTADEVRNYFERDCQPALNWIELRASQNNGKSWRLLSKIMLDYAITSMSSNPGCLARLPNGKLVLIYADRGRNPRLVARVSADGGCSWSDEYVLRAGFTSQDIGYPRIATMGFGRLVIVYYCVTEAHPRQHIESIVWDAEGV